MGEDRRRVGSQEFEPVKTVTAEKERQPFKRHLIRGDVPHYTSLIEPLFVPIVIVILVAYLSATSDAFATWGNTNNVLGQMVILGIASFGMTFVILGRGLDLSVGAGVALTSVFASSVMVNTGSPWLGMVAGLGTGVGVGILNGFFVTALQVPPFIATLGMLVILRGIGLSYTDGGVIFGLPESFTDIGRGEFLAVQYIVWLMIVIFMVLYFVQRRTVFGVWVYCVGDNPEAARLAGIPVNRVRFLTYVISGVTMGLAGLALMARVESGQPNGGQLLELFAIAAVVIGGTSLFGGRGSIGRTLLGVVLIVVLKNGLDVKGVSFDVQQTIIGLVFIGAASVDFVRRRLERRAWIRARTRRVRESASKSGSRPVTVDEERKAPVSEGESVGTSEGGRDK
jgi:ribose transport system permease protein